MSSTSPQWRTKRRSQRFALILSISLHWTAPSGERLNIPAKATSLNLYGSTVILGRELTVGQQISVRNGKVIPADARVVDLVRSSPNQYVYGIEFLQSGEGMARFWGIQFPEAAPAANRNKQFGVLR